ncbi:MAG: hypothetical protein WDN69_30030 [Aliidongia sp.]
MKKLNWLTASAAALLAAIVIAPPSARADGFLGSAVGSLAGPGAGGAPAASPADLSTSLGGLSTTFAASFQNMLLAESLSAKAFGLKAESEQLEKTAAYYGKGNIEDYDQVGRDVTVAADTQAKIDQKMAAATTTDAAAKKQLSAAAPYYAVGTAHAATLPGQYAAWVARAQATMKSNPVALASNSGLVTQVPKVAQLSTRLPDLTAKWISVTKGFVTFTHKQKIDTGDLSSKVGEL